MTAWAEGPSCGWNRRGCRGRLHAAVRSTIHGRPRVTSTAFSRPHAKPAAGRSDRAPGDLVRRVQSLPGEVVTSALVVTVFPDRRKDVLLALRAEPGVSLGEVFGDCVPVVLQTQTAQGGEALVERLEGLGGVALVSVVRIDFCEEPDGSS